MQIVEIVIIKRIEITIISKFSMTKFKYMNLYLKYNLENTTKLLNLNMSYIFQIVLICF